MWIATRVPANGGARAEAALADSAGDLLVTLRSARPGRYSPASAPGSLDLPRAGLRVAGRRLSTGAARPGFMNRAGSASAPWTPPSHGAGRTRNGWVFFAQPWSGLINRKCCGTKVQGLPRFHRTNAALRCPAGAKLPPEWPVRSFAYRLRKPRAGGRQRPRHRTRGGARPGSGCDQTLRLYYPEAGGLLAERGFDFWVGGGPGDKALAQETSPPRRQCPRRITAYRPAQRIVARRLAGVAFPPTRVDLSRRRSVGTADDGPFFGPTTPISGRR